MKVVRTKAELRSALEPARDAGRAIGLVPTMGYLHDGHLSLIRAARERCDVVVMSSFVNPAQFKPSEDLNAYPRDDARDAELAADAGVDLLYAPDVEDVYPDGFSTWVEVEGALTEVPRGCCRSTRPRPFPRGDHGGGEAAERGRSRRSPSSVRRTPSRRS